MQHRQWPGITVMDMTSYSEPSLFNSLHITNYSTSETSVINEEIYSVFIIQVCGQLELNPLKDAKFMKILLEMEWVDI